MTPLYLSPLVAVDVLALAALLLLIAAIYALVETCALGLGPRRIAVAAGLLAVLATLDYTAACANYSASSPDTKFLWVAMRLIRMPLALHVALVGALGAAEAFVILRLWSIAASRITPDSVKEAMDALPDGVCFSDAGGRPLLVNALMDELGHDALGTFISDERLMWTMLWDGTCMPGYQVEHLGEGEGRTSVLLTSPEGRAWEFGRQEMVLDGARVVETIATDVTEERALADELERRNARLAEVNLRLRAYGSDLVRLTRDEEILSAKIHVHDEVGRALVALRAYERQDPSVRDRHALLDLWQGMTLLLHSAARDEEDEDAWGLLVRAAQAVDVRLELEGELPATQEARALTVTLVHECLNNAVRHAGAHEVRVASWREGRVSVVRITNDGDVPAASAAETGGLADMRRAVERAGGTMDVRWAPRFELTARLSSEEE